MKLLRALQCSSLALGSCVTLTPLPRAPATRAEPAPMASSSAPTLFAALAPTASEAPPADDAAPRRAKEADAAGAASAAKTMAADLLRLLRWSAREQTITFDALATDMSLAALKKRVALEPTPVEWHANFVGARWTQPGDITCEACARRGYEIMDVELFDRQLSLLAIRSASVGRAPGVPALGVCEALRAQVESSVDGAEAGPCLCREQYIVSDMAAHSLPGHPKPRPPPCDPETRANFTFQVPAIVAARWGRLRGLGTVDEKETRLSLELCGRARMRFLDVNDRAANR